MFPARILPLIDQVFEIDASGNVNPRSADGRPAPQTSWSSNSPVKSPAIVENPHQLDEKANPTQVAAANVEVYRRPLESGRLDLYKYYGRASGYLAAFVLIISTLLCAFCEYFPCEFVQTLTILAEWIC